MTQYLESFLQHYAYPQKDIQMLLRAYDSVYSNVETAALWDSLLADYDTDIECDINGAIDRIAELQPILGVHTYTLTLLYAICLTKKAREYYTARGLDMKLYDETMRDLFYKTEECREVYGICGTFVGKWFTGFFRLTRFALGRLQFEVIPFKRNYEKGNLKLSPDTSVINVHIPRTGTPMDAQSCSEAFAKAAQFFAPQLNGAPVAFVCHSWLLFPEHQTMLKETTNIRRYMDRFEILESGEYADYSELWRVYDRQYNGNPETLGYATSLHRAYTDRIKAGKKTGWGFGIYFWNPEKQ